jgi:hypothetical protein
LAQWYNILQKAGYITPESFVKAEPETLEGEPAEEVSVEKEAPKKAAPKQKSLQLQK